MKFLDNFIFHKECIQNVGELHNKLISKARFQEVLPC